MFLTRAGISDTFSRSKAMNLSDPGRARLASSIADDRSSFIRRATAIASNPSQINRRTMPNPRPRLPPVTMTLRMAGQLAGSGDLKGGDDADRRRNHVPRQSGAAVLQDLARALRAVGVTIEHDVRRDERADNGIALRPHA